MCSIMACSAADYPVAGEFLGVIQGRVEGEVGWGKSGQWLLENTLGGAGVGRNPFAESSKDGQSCVLNGPCIVCVSNSVAALMCSFDYGIIYVALFFSGPATCADYHGVWSSLDRPAMTY